MSTGKQKVRDLVDEAKKRIVLLAVCVVGLSYLMSLTSSSVWVNLPFAVSIIFLLRYISLDIDMRKRAAAYKNKPAKENHVLDKKSPQGSKVFVDTKKVVAHEKTYWRRKVNSPVVEAAIDQFSRHLISEWVTDLWYSRLTPDKDGPEELVQIINGVLGEISCRAREVNLIDLLTRDIINLFCAHLEVFRTSQAKIEKQKLASLTIDRRDVEIKLVLAAENKLHPALFSAEAEHKVLQHLMDGLISITFRQEDLYCSFFRYIVRELLACAVMRPVLNLASPRFINERIESVVLSNAHKANKGATPTAQEASHHKPNGASRTSSGQFLGLQDPSISGVELVQLKHENSGVATDEPVKKKVNGTTNQKDPLLSLDARSSHSWNSLPSDSQILDSREIQRHQSGGEWGQVLDVISHRKTQVLAPEHFENMWTKGRNYKTKGGDNSLNKQVVQNLLSGSHISDHSKVLPKQKIKDGKPNINFLEKSTSLSPCGLSLAGKFRVNNDGSNLSYPPVASKQEIEENEHGLSCSEEVDLESESSYPTEDDENNNVTGLDSPGTKVWDSKNKRNDAVSYIHHPLESSEGHMAKKTGKKHANSKTIPRIHSNRKRSRLSVQKVQTWQEVERTSFLVGDGKDILNTSNDVKADESSDDPELESWGRAHSGASASSSVASFSVSEAHNSSIHSPVNSVLADSFLKLRCEVLGANVVKSDSRTFAVYSISVTDVDNSSWSIKRRFRHFEELHRRLKEFSEYNLSLPPKHFLSSGLDAIVIQERCKLLDRYLKRLLQLPTISGSIEVWDFLSVDSQTYMFSNSLSIVQTLSIDLDDKPYEKGTKVQLVTEPADDHFSSRAQNLGIKSKENLLQMKQNLVPDSSSLKARNILHSSVKSCGKEGNIIFEDSGSDSDREHNTAPSIRKPEKPLNQKVIDSPKETSELLLDAATDPTLPTEWIPPNLSAPILDLVDTLFQLQDGGWVRRQAFWVAKQVLQLGMGDAFDDWLIEKIQLLRRGSVIASAIKRVEQILWPDGIFLTKHPKRKRPSQSISQSQSPRYASQSPQISSPKNEDVQKASGSNNLLTDEQQQEEAARRAKFVYELMIDKAPAPLVSLFGRKEYEKSVKDLYYFSQSSVCLKQLAYDLLELLLLSAFPELDDVIKQLHKEKHKFGQLESK